MAAVPVVFCVGGNHETARNIRSPRFEPRTSPIPGRIVELGSSVWCKESTTRVVTSVGLLDMWAQQHGLSVLYKKTANYVLCGVIQILYKGVLYPPNVVRFRGTRVNL